MKTKKIILFLILIISSILGFLSIAPSVAKNTDDGFNSVNALKHLQVISEEPHSVTDYEAHEKVRQYLLKTSKMYVGEGNVEERNYSTVYNQNPTDGITYVGAATEEECKESYDIRNVLAKIPGRNDTGILLVAHYDSRGNIVRFGELAHSYGAGDDGYGVITLLEIMRYFAGRTDLENSIYFLFTDAEEVGMDGSYQESRKNTELMNKVNFVINVEARGLRGASYMFEASKKNQGVMKMYQKASDRVTYSIAPAVYSVMTNYTDFTNFLEIGKQGLNFSTLDNIGDYHVPYDNYTNVHQGTIQHYGEQILPIVIEYSSQAKYADMDYFVSNHDMIFFNFLPGVFVEYVDTIGLVLSILVLLAAIAYCVISTIQKNLSWKKMGIQFGIYLAWMVVFILFGWISSKIIARLEGFPWSLTNVRCDNFKIIFPILLTICIFISYKLFSKFTKEEEDKKSFLVSGILFLSVLDIVVCILLPGASFLFLLPSLFGILYCYVAYFISIKLVNRILVYITVFVLCLVFIPLVYSLLLAVTIGGALALFMITYLAFGMILPMTQSIMD